MPQSRRPARSYEERIDPEFAKFVARIRHSLLSREEELALAKRIERGDLAAKEYLIEHNLLLVKHNVWDFRNQGLEELDLLNEGVQGLIRAAEKYDWRRGVRFSTYATAWIRQALQRAIQNKGRLLRLPVPQEELLRKLKLRAERFEKSEGREPTLFEQAEFIGLSVQKLKDLLEVSQTATSLDLMVSSDEDTTLGELLPDASGVAVAAEVEAHLRGARLDEILAELPDLEATIIRRRFGIGTDEPQSFVEIGASLKISPEKASRCMSSGLTWLREQHGDELRELFEDLLASTDDRPAAEELQLAA